MSGHHVKRLMIMRHAKSAWPDDVADHERPLAKRGHHEAPMVGRWMVENGSLPDFILCSSALRTRQTCTWVCSELGEKAPTPLLSDEVYAASGDRILHEINHLPGGITNLLVIGHMPGVQELAMRLASVESDEEAVMNMASHYPTSGLTVLEHAKEWAELDGRDAKVTNFVVLR
ncbi:histidine phosphatase family protein [Arthrobacter sp. I2-34]|uniref:Histidine phosphatase family protein n=1 Tax=Arthrobacter hankyongi TaxID=2904801 RepID=A0ABS9L8P1_9MICC|nr:histidine phosphatase family protein [Arthrobacter hankyongi]MCG2622859.1 histidine phosphatase family protein [Arthrobacter hankyongi]